MKHEINASHVSGMAFDISLPNNQKIRIDAPEQAGGNNSGPTPKPLVLAALAGCTGMDVVSILNKMRVKYDTMNIKVEADLSDDHPKKYTAMKIIYELSGKDISYEKVDKAVKLSQDQYCGVSAMYKDAVELDYEIVINP